MASHGELLPQQLRTTHLKLLLLEVSPEPLDNLGPGQLLVLLGADNGGKLL